MKKVKNNGQLEVKDLVPFKTLGMNTSLRRYIKDLVANDNTHYYTFKPEGAGSMIAYLYNKNLDLPLLNIALPVNTPTKDFIVADVRPYLNKEGNVKNKADANLTFANVAFEDLWSNEGYAEIQSLSDYPMYVFINIIAKLIESIYHPGINDISSVKIIAGMNVLTRVYGELDKDRMAVMLARLAVLPYEMVYSKVTAILETHRESVGTVDSMANAISMHTDSAKLNKLNGRVLMERYYRIFFGTGAREKLAMSMEHFPVWMSLVYAAAEDKQYKKSMLGGFIASTPRSQKEAKEEFVLRSGKIIEPYIMDKFDNFLIY